MSSPHKLPTHSNIHHASPITPGNHPMRIGLAPGPMGSILINKLMSDESLVAILRNILGTATSVTMDIKSVYTIMHRVRRK